MTGDIKIPGEMVEAAARALAECRVGATMPAWVRSRCWDEPPVPPSAVEKWRESFRAEVRIALAAALSVCWVRQQHGVALDEQAVSACHSYCTNDEHERDRVRLVIQTPWREWSDD